MLVPSARRIFSPPPPRACLDELAASNSDAADDCASIGRSRSLLTLGPTLSYDGARRRCTGDIAGTYEHARCRGSGPCDELAAGRCAGSPSSRRDRPSEAILGVSATRRSTRGKRDGGRMSSTVATTIVRCANCGRRNRVPDVAKGVPRCSQCHQPLPWIVDAGDASFAEVAEQATVPVIVDLISLKQRGRRTSSGWAMRRTGPSFRFLRTVDGVVNPPA